LLVVRADAVDVRQYGTKSLEPAARTPQADLVFVVEGTEIEGRNEHRDAP
jgi:hypothetical protein